MSTHKVEIVEIGPVETHPDPEVEKIEMTHVFGWQCCIGKGQFREGDKAVYVPPDYLVPTDHPSFAFLKQEERDKERIRVRRFRGALSQGLLIQLPSEFSHLPIGTNLIEELGIERYEPPLPKSTGGDFVSGPSGLYSPKFDVENFQRYINLFKDGEEVIVTEKIHGASGRYVFHVNKDGDATQFCGSRTNWMAKNTKNIWWMAFEQSPGISQWCQSNPGKILYGEVFGQVQSLKYGARVNDIFFAAFGILDQNRWSDYDDCRKSLAGHGVNMVPLIYRGPFRQDITRYAEGLSYWPCANHMREGICIVPAKERTDVEIGRVILKVVSNTYLEKGK